MILQEAIQVASPFWFTHLCLWGTPYSPLTISSARLRLLWRQELMQTLARRKVRTNDMPIINLSCMSVFIVRWHIIFGGRLLLYMRSPRFSPVLFWRCCRFCFVACTVFEVLKVHLVGYLVLEGLKSRYSGWLLLQYSVVACGNKSKLHGFFPKPLQIVICYGMEFYLSNFFWG